MKYGRLTLLNEFRERNKRGDSVVMWFCSCECGGYKTATRSKIKNGHTSSCGCLAKEVISKRCSKGEGEASFNSSYNSYKRSARTRGYDFDLTKEEFKKIATKPCYFCGDDSKQNYHKKKAANGHWYFTGIDRYDNDKGYSVENCVPCCSLCNTMKMALPVEMFIEHIKKISSWVRTA